MKSLKDQSGYTLVELIVAMAIFSVVIIVAVGSFVSVQKNASKSAAQRKVQQDVRYNLETMTRQIRSSSIDYAFYTNQTDPRCTLDGRNMLALYVTEAGDSNTPVNKRVFYYAANNRLISKTFIDTTTIPDCGTVLNSDASQVQQTADNITINPLQFFISPTSDPAKDTTAVGIQSGVRNTHPRVTVLMTAQTGTQQASSDTVKIETTVSTRSYPLTTVFGSGT